MLTWGLAGKGIVGWVNSAFAETPEHLGNGTHRSDESSQSTKSQAAIPLEGRDVKIVVGNKAMMLEADIPISSAVDEYMREMEVHFVEPLFHMFGKSSPRSRTGTSRGYCLLQVLLSMLHFDSLPGFRLFTEKVSTNE